MATQQRHPACSPYLATGTGNAGQPNILFREAAADDLRKMGFLYVEKKIQLHHAAELAKSGSYTHALSIVSTILEKIPENEKEIKLNLETIVISICDTLKIDSGKYLKKDASVESVSDGVDL